jgi:ParB-like nuclease domain
MLIQDLKIETWPIERLVPYARNARSHSEAQVAQIAASIVEFGFNNPVLVGADGGIIAGQARVLAARKLGFTEIPVIVLGHLTENQKRAFVLADNKLALNAGWDFETLRLELEALAVENFDLKLTGFDELELAEVMALEATTGSLEPDAVPELESEPVSRTGDMWMLGKHRMLCGDGTCGEELARVLDGKPCQLVFTDPPYNVDYCGKGPDKMKLGNDNLGPEFAAFLRSACDAMLAVSQGPVYICMSSSELATLQSAFCAAVAIGRLGLSGRRTPSRWGARTTNVNTNRFFTDGARERNIIGAETATRATCGRRTSRCAMIFIRR